LARFAGEAVVDLAAADPALPATLAELIIGGERALERVAMCTQAVLSGRLEHAATPLAQTRLHAPAVPRPRIACAAGNYAPTSPAPRRARVSRPSPRSPGWPPSRAVPTLAQITERSRARERPRGFWKDFALPAGTEDEIVYPRRAANFDYEGEVVVVLGTAAKDVAPGRGGAQIWGITLLNDWSIRGGSVKDSLSFNLGKNFDGAASVGPCIVVGGLDPADIDVRTHVNGELRQSYNSGDMLYSHAEYIEFLSRDFTLLPGDMVSGGSGPGSATDSDGRFLQPGDVVDVSADAIGVLHNVVVANPASPVHGTET